MRVLFFYVEIDVRSASDRIVFKIFSLYGCVLVGVAITQTNTLCETENRVTKFSLLEHSIAAVHIIKD